MVDQLSFEPPTAGAVFSSCGRYRYTLWRTWCREDKLVCWVMLNPSTADASKLDPTCTRCLKYAQRWGYGRMIVTNIFALRSTDPQALYETDDPIGPDNDRAILESAGSADLVIAAWGAHGALLSRGEEVLQSLIGIGVHVHVLRMTKSGHPGHPLYLPADLRPVRRLGPGDRPR